MMLTRIQQERRDRAHSEVCQGADLSSLALRQIIRDRFAWPGGYELFGVTSDGAVLCCACMRAEYRQIAWSRRNKMSDDWRVVGASHTADCDDFTVCDHCAAVLFDPED